MHLGCMTTLAIGSNKSEGSAAWTRLHAKTSRTTKNRVRMRIVFSSSRPELILQRQLPNSLPGRREYRVGHGGGGDSGTRLADSSGSLIAANQVHFDRWRLIDPQNANIVEVRLLHASVLERHLAVEGSADSEDDPTLDLRFHGVGVHNRAAVDRADHPVHAHFARLRHRYLGDLGDVGIPAPAVHERDATPAAGW